MRAKKAGPKISQQLAALQRLALAASGVGEREALLSQLYKEIQLLLAPDGVIVTLCRSELEQIELALLVEEGKLLSELTGQCFPLEESGLHGWVIEQGKAVLVGNLATETLPEDPHL
ncbi:MAG: hypothetical protein H0T73_04125, partial [Ardenticatenales bacterium]|nr:hypothetical protein [Ardenticatenales bacterium]